jgi:FtsP/CotA-like multicopper oxidase with cupredoxin domain
MGRGTTRRDFLRRSAAGAAVATAGAAGGILYSHATAQAQHVDIRMFVNAGFLQRHDGTQVYHWGFGPTAEEVTLPGSVIRAIEGDTLTVSVTNMLEQPHSFAIAGVTDTGPIAPGETSEVSFDAPAAGTYLYLDALGAPVNRVLGLHGALVVHPAGAPDVPVAGGPRFARELVWVFSCLDPRWCERARLGRPVASSPFEPRIFVINGRFGEFSSLAVDTTPQGRLGEPALIRMVNAGLAVKSVHFHGNHVRVLARNGQPPPVPMTKDTVFVGRGETVDVLLPFHAPADAFPAVRTSAYPVHDHQEMTQTLEGGLHPNGLLTPWELQG